MDFQGLEIHGISMSVLESHGKLKFCSVDGKSWNMI